MAKQNIYDNEIFFEGYKKIRDNTYNANNLFEIPALISLLPDVKDKTILDLGCGFGEHCKLFVEKGAKKVVGLDISKKMIEKAKEENSSPKIEYVNLPMEDMITLRQKFDIVVSSLAFHYIESYKKLIEDIYSLLKVEGTLIFSQEHPFTTCHKSGERWTKNDEGIKIYANISNYSREGERDITWIVDNVKKYHRTFSTIINTLVEKGFRIEKIIEPIPDEDILKNHPEYTGLLHKPDFLLVKAVKVRK